MLKDIYKTSLVNLTDLYQLTMGYAYWKNNIHETESVFHLFFRKAPFGGKYAIFAGLEYVIDFVNDFHYTSEDIAFLKTLNGADGNPLFDDGYLRYLEQMKITCTIHSVSEGEKVFPNEPLIRIQGTIIQCQLLETALLNIINFQTLIATKASRVVEAAAGDKVMEFGLRRAQGIDGGLAASRAAYIGGCDATSNVLAGQLFGIPVAGTHAHSWVMSFDSEEEAFEKYVFAQPNNSTLLVDTYDTIQGVRNAIKTGVRLRDRGFDLNGIRLDSGDLAAFSIEARKLLNDFGFHKTKIVASNDLDEYKIAELKLAGAKIDTWGVGTAMVTGDNQSALGGVYKLGAIKKNGQWVNRIKISSDEIKCTNPGILRVYRLHDEDIDLILNQNCEYDAGRQHLLMEVWNAGEESGPPHSLAKARKLAAHGRTSPDRKVALHHELAAEKKKMIEEAKR